MKEATGNCRHNISTCLVGLLGGILTLSVASSSQASPVGAFNYDPITEPILSATFSADFAALTAHRTVLGQEVNMAMLLDISTGLPDFDMSDDLFGTAVWPAPADLDQGSLGTGIVSAAVDPSFFPALESGSVGLWFLATDTDDAMFAIDFLSLTVETASGTIVSFHGSTNNGFCIGISDGGLLPDVVDVALPPGSTGTGFCETVSSKSIHIPEPNTLFLLIIGTVLIVRKHWRRCAPLTNTPRVGMSRLETVFCGAAAIFFASAMQPSVAAVTELDNFGQQVTFHSPTGSFECSTKLGQLGCRFDRDLLRADSQLDDPRKSRHCDKDVPGGDTNHS